MRILIVEDDPLVAMTAAAALEDAGHDVIGPAYDADEAWEMVSRDLPDLALVDVNLSGNEEGLALATELKDRFGLRSIYVTGQPPSARRHRAAAIGVLSKPYDPRVLVATVDVAREIMAGVMPPLPRIPPMLELFTA